MADLTAGSNVAGYSVEGLLGRGGMGAVYRARDVERGRLVALKVIAGELAGDAVFRERFRREALAAAALEHPHVVPVFEAGEHRGALYIAMGLVDGVDLASLIGRVRLLSPELAVRLVEQVATALDAAHSVGLVHRDVKPANILVAGPEGEPHAYLTDFGVARRLQERTRLTGTGLVVGTLGYLAPEALRGEGSGPAVDVYALGCVLFEALTGELPFVGDNDVAVVLAHLEQPPPSLAARVPGIPAALEAVVERALAKDPAERFASANALARAARLALEPNGSSAAAAPGRPPDATATLAARPAPAPPREPTPTRKRVTLLYTVAALGADLDLEVRFAAQVEFERLVRPILERHGATVERSPTEGMIAVFGLPTLHEDDAARAIRAALELHNSADGSASAAVPTTAITTDVVLAGGGMPPATTVGGLLDLALGMCRVASPGDILISDATYQLAASSARFERLENGSGSGPGLWRALQPDVSTPASPVPARLVGRGRELRRSARRTSARDRKPLQLSRLGGR